MSELLEIIIEAVDNASETFETVANTASEMGDEISSATEGNVREWNDVVSAADEAAESVSGVADAVGGVDSAPVQDTADATHEVEEGASGAGGELENINNLLTGFAGAEIFNMLADSLWAMADKAGTVQDSISRMGLAAEGAGIPIGEMQSAVSKLGTETGRAGGQIRESFIAMTSAGITDMGTMQQLFKGASAQAFILGTDVDSLANKFSGMAMKSNIAEKTLKGTGITIDELGKDKKQMRLIRIVGKVYKPKLI